MVQSIVDDVHTTLLSLRQQLLHLLTEQASLPKELQILATLRKLDGLLIDRQLALERHENEILAQMTDKQREKLRQHLLQCSETRLQMDFLEARSIWLERVADHAIHGFNGENSGVLGSGSNNSGGGNDRSEGEEKGNSNKSNSNSSNGIIPQGGSLGPYGRALEMLEVNRTTWFLVITQFKALFEENDDSIDNSGGSNSLSIEGNERSSGSGFQSCSHPPTAILGAWATTQVGMCTDVCVCMCITTEQPKSFTPKYIHTTPYSLPPLLLHTAHLHTQPPLYFFTL